MGAFGTLAEAFRYPAPGRAAALHADAEGLPAGAARSGVLAFLEEVGKTSFEEWEELYARTLDLSPASAPYVGYQVWGDKPPRGQFLVEMQAAVAAAGVDRDGEVADHLVPVLRYLDAESRPLPRLLDALGPALRSLHRSLEASQPPNPYRHLFFAALRQAGSLIEDRPNPVGGRRNT